MHRREFIASRVLPLFTLGTAAGEAGRSSVQLATPKSVVADRQSAVRPGAMSGLSFPGRSRIPLEGEWDYEAIAWTFLQEDGSCREERKNIPGPGRMRVPSNWHLTGLPDFHGRVAFRRQFTAGPDFVNEGVWLCFARADYFARVTLNGHLLGEHQGYFEPFEVEVTGLLKGGANLLEVVVDSPREEPNLVWPRHKRLIKGILNQWLPMDRQMEPTGGITGKVYLERRPRVQVRSAKFTARLASGDAGGSSNNLPLPEDQKQWAARRVAVVAEIEFWTGDPGPIDMEVTIGESHWRGEVFGQAGTNQHFAVLTIENPQLWWTWDLGDQMLYRAIVSVARGAEADHCECKVGIREIQFDPARGEWRLNGERFFVRGSNVIPSKWLAHYSDAQIDQDMELLRKAHVNGVRVCVHVSRDEFYAACDREGILIWQDFPLQWQYALDAPVVAEAVRQIRAMIRHLYNHPSIGLWTCQNEPEPANRQGMDPALSIAARTEESSRHVSEAAEFGEHPYPGWYYGGIRDFETIPAAPVVSEFGAQGLPSPDEMRRLLGPDVWPPNSKWVDNGFEPNSTFNVAGISPGKNLEEFVKNSQTYQARLIQFAVEQYRRVKYQRLGGFFHFMFMDGWPTIGWSVLTYDRIPKRGYWALQRALQPVLAIAVLGQTRWPSKLKHLHFRNAWVVNDTRAALDKCRVIFELRGPQGNIPLKEFVVDVPADSVQALVPDHYLSTPLPGTGVQLPPGEYVLAILVRSSSGDLLSENLYELAFVNMGVFAETSATI